MAKRHAEQGRSSGRPRLSMAAEGFVGTIPASKIRVPCEAGVTDSLVPRAGPGVESSPSLIGCCDTSRSGRYDNFGHFTTISDTTPSIAAKAESFGAPPPLPPERPAYRARGGIAVAGRRARTWQLCIRRTRVRLRPFARFVFRLGFGGAEPDDQSANDRGHDPEHKRVGEDCDVAPCSNRRAPHEHPEPDREVLNLKVERRPPLHAL